MLRMYLISFYSLQYSSKNISREYEVFMLQEGEFDERMFLSGNAEEEIGTPRTRLVFGALYRVICR